MSLRDPLPLSICLLLGAALVMRAAPAADPAPDPLLGTWTGSVHDAGESRPFGLRFVTGKNSVPDMLWTLPEANIRDYGPYSMQLQDGWYYEAAQDHYDLKYRLSDDQTRVYGVLYFDGHALPFDLVKGPLPPATQVDKEGREAKPAWSFKAGGAIWSSAAYADGAVYFGSNDGKVYALDAKGGKPLWQFKTGGAVWGPAAVDGAYVYALSDDGFLYKLARQDGRQVWRFDTHGGSVKRQGFDRLASSAVVADGTLYIGSADGSLYALNPADGSVKWHYPTQGMVRSTPAVAGGRVFFGSYDDAIYALDTRSGALLWRRDTLMPVVSTPLVVKDTLYIGSRNADFYALDAATGKKKWRAFDWVSWVESSAAERDGIVYVGCSDCWNLFAYDAASGKELWRFNTGGESWPIPAVTEKRVYIGSVGYEGFGRLGGFYAVDRATGKAVWRLTLPPSGGEHGYGVGASPALGQDLVFFGTLDGTFYAVPAEASRTAM